MSLTIDKLITDSWVKTSGIKKPYWAIVGINLLIFVFFVGLPAFWAFFLFHLFHHSIEVFFILKFIISIVLFITSVLGLLFVLVSMSLLPYFCLRHLRGKPMTVKGFFAFAYSNKERVLITWFVYLIFLFLAWLLLMTLAKVAASILILPLMTFEKGVASILTLLFFLGLLAMVDKQQGVLTSFKQAGVYFFQHFLVCIFAIIWSAILMLASILTLGILSIWAYPAIKNMCAMLYEDMISV